MPDNIRGIWGRLPITTNFFFGANDATRQIEGRPQVASARPKRGNADAPGGTLPQATVDPKPDHKRAISKDTGSVTDRTGSKQPAITHDQAQPSTDDTLGRYSRRFESRR